MARRPVPTFFKVIALTASLVLISAAETTAGVYDERLPTRSVYRSVPIVEFL